jgi:hypothetical protein
MRRMRPVAATAAGAAMIFASGRTALRGGRIGGRSDATDGADATEMVATAELMLMVLTVLPR